MESNGSFGMEEPIPSEPGREETTLLPTDLDTISESTTTLASDHSEMTTMLESDGTMDQEEISKTMAENVSMLLEDQTLTTDTSSSTTATTVQTKDGDLIKLVRDQLVNHTLMESNS